ncbi:MAG: CHAT domain-containing protein, partial [Vicinamibacterales bacterium]
AHDAVGYFDGIRARLRVPRLLLTSARAKRALGDKAGAVEDALRAFERFESETAELPAGETLRLAHSDELWDVVEEATRALVETGRADEAFVLAQRGRARALGIPYSAAQTRPATADGVLLAFTVLPDRLFTWCFTKEDTHFVDRPQDRTALRALVRTLAQSNQPEDERERKAWRATTRELSRLLLHPIGICLRNKRQLHVIPDDILSLVPFAALENGESGGYLIERFDIALRPVASRPTAVAGVQAHGGILVVGSSLASQSLGLPALPGVKREAMRITNQYPRARLLVDTPVTEQTTREAFQTAAIVHVASHAVVNEEYPQLSYVIVPGTTGAPQPLFAREIRAFQLRAQLVLLSACRTSDGPVMRGNGVVSLGSAFLRSGAGAVVSSLWEIPDAIAERLSPMILAAAEQDNVVRGVSAAIRREALTRPN